MTENSGAEKLRDEGLSRMVSLLGILAIVLGPFTGVLGVLAARGKIELLSNSGRVGYRLCWLFGVVVPIVLLALFFLVESS